LKQTATYTILRAVIWLITAALGFGFIFMICSQVFLTKKKPGVQIEIKVPQIETIQTFYDIGYHFNAEHTSSKIIEPNGEFQTITLDLPNDSILKNLRIDLGALPASYIIKRISLVHHYARYDMYPADILKNFKAENDISQFELKENQVYITTTGEDPILISTFDTQTIFNKLKNKNPDPKVPLIISISIFLGIFILVRKKIQHSSIRPSRQLLLVGFFTCTCSSVIFMYLGPPTRGDQHEYRTQAQAPTWEITDWENYLKKYNLYFEDQFGFRSELIAWYAAYKTQVWHSSPIPEKVLMGKNNWLYTVEDSLMEDYRGMRKFKQAQLEEIYANLMYRKKRLLQMGIEYYVIIAPNKQTIYHEFIPSKYTRVDPQTRWLQTKTFLNQQGNNFIIDPTEELLRQKQAYPSYFKTDLHWNNMGAYYASQMLLGEMRKKFPQVHTHALNEYTIQPTPFTQGDMARMIHAGYIEDVQYEFTSPSLQQIVYANAPLFPSYVSTQPIIQTFTPDTTQPHVLMFRDSFGNGMIQFISQESNKAVYVWTHVFDWAIIEQEKPDVVVHEISEKLIHKFLEE
jgi:hypothetical protein